MQSNISLSIPSENGRKCIVEIMYSVLYLLFSINQFYDIFFRQDTVFVTPKNNILSLIFIFRSIHLHFILYKILCNEHNFVPSIFPYKQRIKNQCIKNPRLRCLSLRD